MRKKISALLLVTMLLIGIMVSPWTVYATGVTNKKIKDIDVAVFSNATMVLTEDNELYGSGYTNHGEIGQNNQLDGFQKIDTSALDAPMVDVMAGLGSTIILTENGSVYRSNDGYDTNRGKFEKIDQMAFGYQPVTKMYRTFYQATYITEDGSYYTGRNTDDIIKKELPEGVQVQKVMSYISAGFTYLLDQHNNVWSTTEIMSGESDITWTPVILPNGTKIQDMIMIDSPYFLDTAGNVLYSGSFMNNPNEPLDPSRMDFTDITDVVSFVKFYAPQVYSGYPTVKKTDGEIYAGRGILEAFGVENFDTNDELISTKKYLPGSENASAFTISRESYPTTAGSYIVDGEYYAINGDEEYSNGVLSTYENPLPPLTIEKQYFEKTVIYNPESIILSDREINPTKATLGPGMQSTNPVQANWEITNSLNAVVSSGIIPFVDAKSVELDIASLNLPFGEYTVSFFRETTDEYTGNYLKSAETVETTFTLVELPVAPTLNAIEAGTNPTISGDGKAGAVVTITLPNDEKITTVVDATGNWTIESPIPLVDGDVVKAEQTDEYDNTSPSTETTVKDTTLPDAPTLNAIEAGTNPTISGKGEAGAVVTITLPNDEKITTVVDATGNWTIESPITLVDGDVVKAEQTDTYDFTSPSTETTVKDTTLPDAPTLNAIEAGTNPTISGKGEAGAVVTITLPNDKKIVTRVDTAGNWTIESPITLVDGDIVKAEQTDEYDNTSPSTETTVKDTTAPDAPILNAIEAGTNPTISGKGEAGAIIAITLPNDEKITTVVDATGNWTIKSPITLVDGAVVKAEQTDAYGNTSPSTETIVKDTTLPDAPMLNAIEAGTNPTISGGGEAGAVVTITLPNDEKITTVVDATGNWTIESPITLVDGDVVKAEQTDAYKNTSPSTETIVKDTIAPSAPTLNAIEAGTNPTISGTGEAGAIVTITLPNDEKIITLVDTTGNWTIESPIALVDGDVVKVEQTDAYGNTSTQIEEIIKENQKPEMLVTTPTVNGINPGDKIISGKADPNVIIEISLPNGTVLEGNTDANGNFTVNVPEGIELAEGEQIHTIAVDENGATSAPAITTVTDTISPVAPTINEVEAGEKPTLSGGGEPGATVTITLPNGEKITTIVDENGNWIIESPIALLPGNQIVVTQTDSNGNTSVEVETTITETIQTAYKVTGENISMNITEYNSKKADGTLADHIRVESDAKAWRQPDNEEVGPVEIDLSNLKEVEVQVTGEYEVGISYTIMPDTDTTTRSIIEPQIVSETIVITITGNDIIIPGLPITGENIFQVILIGMVMFIISFIILIVGRRKKRV